MAKNQKIIKIGKIKKHGEEIECFKKTLRIFEGSSLLKWEGENMLVVAGLLDLLESKKLTTEIPEAFLNKLPLPFFILLKKLQ